MRPFMHRSFTIKRRCIARPEKSQLRISAGDSREKPVLASGVKPRSRSARKFFYCQNPRLRVRAISFLPRLMERSEIDRVSIA
jgi:hypothetical protein